MFGLNVKLAGIGSVEAPRVEDRHEQKSFAGRLFHNPLVESVCVFDETGEVPLYLKKTSQGVYKEER